MATVKAVDSLASKDGAQRKGNNGDCRPSKELQSRRVNRGGSGGSITGCAKLDTNSPSSALKFTFGSVSELSTQYDGTVNKSSSKAKSLSLIRLNPEPVNESKMTSARSTQERQLACDVEELKRGCNLPLTSKSSSSGNFLCTKSSQNKLQQIFDSEVATKSRKTLDPSSNMGASHHKLHRHPCYPRLEHEPPSPRNFRMSFGGQKTSLSMITPQKHNEGKRLSNKLKKMSTTAFLLTLVFMAMGVLLLHEGIKEQSAMEAHDESGDSYDPITDALMFACLFVLAFSEFYTWSGRQRP